MLPFKTRATDEDQELVVTGIPVSVDPAPALLRRTWFRSTRPTLYRYESVAAGRITLTP